MTELLSPTPVHGKEARDWLKESLGAGHEISFAVMATASLDDGQISVIVSRGTAPSKMLNFPEGAVIKTSEADAALAHVLDELAREGASCLVVEDDLARRTDPGLDVDTIPSAFIGDRVVTWHDLSPGLGTDAVDTMRRVAGGYPRNAFVSKRAAADFNLAPGQMLPESFAREVAESLLAVVVSAYDDESFLIWDRRETSAT